MKMKAAAPAALALLVVMAMMEGSAQAAACPSQFPLTCASYVLDSRSVPLKTCSIELVQDNFQLLKPTSSLKSFCEAIKGVKLYNGPLTGTQLNLALGLPEKCALSGQYKKGQSCNESGSGMVVYLIVLVGCIVRGQSCPEAARDESKYITYFTTTSEQYRVTFSVQDGC
ncbi:hypothetical protein KC19_9G167700 [Ceratodon purpureus]|uniref:Bifunctional inhibitor/plant lipid transfer protein/seed storage helical domain-containing protein n=1 Tax=Ceratodon purpureus TaxID=3225 RepID=A0A8T0GX83_CERPU|nr:hypothetical protein KC19_9G167700 [Ceratodon purpureus]